MLRDSELLRMINEAEQQPSTSPTVPRQVRVASAAVASSPVLSELPRALRARSGIEERVPTRPVSGLPRAIAGAGTLAGAGRTPAPVPSHESVAREAYPSAADDGSDDADGPPEPTLTIPSTWINPPKEEQPSWLARQARTAAVGIGAGLIIVLPTLLFLGQIPISGGSSQARSPAGVVASQRQAARERLSLASMGPGESAARSKASDAIQAEAAVAVAAGPGTGDPALLLATVELLVTNGDLLKAREVLGSGPFASHPEVAFARAETFDPNMLAAWGIRDAQADAARARALYEQALAGGVTRARARLSGLQ